MSARRLSLVLALACGCATGGSETGNPVVEKRLGLGVRSEDPGVIEVGGSGAGGTVLEEAWLAFGEVTLLGEAECANLGEIDIFGPTQVAADLAQVQREHLAHGQLVNHAAE